MEQRSLHTKGFEHRKIIQTSEPGTASTVLFNLLYGFISPDLPVDCGNGSEDTKKDIVVTHNTHLESWTAKLQSFELFFISSERQALDRMLDTRHYSYPRLLRFDFDELNVTKEYSLEKMVTHVHGRLRDFLPSEIQLNIETAISRIEDMNKFYETIKDEPFTFFDKFYHIHGHHRGRT